MFDLISKDIISKCNHLSSVMTFVDFTIKIALFDKSLLFQLPKNVAFTSERLFYCILFALQIN